MSYEKFFRLSGAIAVLSFVATLTANVGLYASLIPASWEYPSYLFVSVLFLFTLFSLYARQVDKAGYLGLAGFFLAAISLLLSIIWYGYASLVFPVLRVQFPDAVRPILGGPLGAAIMISLYLGLLGNLLFFVATIRARVLPAWGAALVIAGQVIAFLPLPINLGTVISTAGLAWLGYAMWASGSVYAPSLQSRQPASE